MIYHLDLRGRNQGGPVLPGRIVILAGGNAAATEDALRREPRVVFLTHGFNVNRTSGQAQLQAFAASLPRAASAALVAVTWPGDSWAGPAGYSFEGNDADDSAAELARFIDRVLRAGTELCFVSHSLGARVVMETIKRLDASRWPVTQVCVMAPAIDDTSVSTPRVYRNAVEDSQRVAVLGSEGDRVLRWAYPAGDLLQAFVFFWKDVSGAALGLHGPRPDARWSVPENLLTRVAPRADGVDHGDYLFAGAPNDRQKKAVAFADAVLAGAVP